MLATKLFKIHINHIIGAKGKCMKNNGERKKERKKERKANWIKWVPSCKMEFKQVVLQKLPIRYQIKY